MAGRIVLGVFLGFWLGGGVRAEAPEGVEKEVFDVLEKVKSRDASERTAGVRELMGVREAISERLRTIVTDANQRRASDAAKGSSLWLIGKLGLVQCRDVYEAERNWKWRPKGPFRSIRESRFFRPDTSRWNRRARVLKSGISVRSTGPTADLSAYPVLSNALADLAASEDDRSWYNPQVTIYRWNKAVVDGLQSILGVDVWWRDVYPDNVKITAAYLLGEFKPRKIRQLLMNIDLKDEEGICANYPEVLKVETPEAEYPCAVALLKSYPYTYTKTDQALEDHPNVVTSTAPYKDMKSYYVYAMGRKEISQEGRERIARVMMAIDAEAAKAAYHACVAEIRAVPTSAETLARLESVSEIIN